MDNSATAKAAENSSEATRLTALFSLICLRWFQALTMRSMSLLEDPIPVQFIEIAVSPAGDITGMDNSAPETQVFGDTQ